ncbi:hypothetical protein SYJ56_13815 [Algoriphagus sp. D3-2-R+10]|uniref:hypothetical protein n=1 Tax=Algoriphagus aurantiacus TaxID=3103948 RepID=UPI002B38448B|nr:hypothetical protein [Algoriphagus sp. D3-2-R+10]MEB2776394.1 hypothetical protein [Algoriphagus sp. D3-2-R+10]
MNNLFFLKSKMQYIPVKFNFLLLLIFLSNSGYSQETTLVSNDMMASGRLQQKTKNPFNKFIGEWTLKDDNWSQNWGNGTENIRIPNHHTVCKELNTDNSLLAVIDGTPPYGHIFWSYNPVKKEVDHLSSFGTTRAGVGKGKVNENGDVTLKISFADEAEGTYRLYTYKWISENEYDLKSIQYNDKNEATGYFYGGTFVRIDTK